MIRWTKPTESGLGDRLVDIVHLLAYARVKRQGLCFDWPQFRLKPIDIAHRNVDIQLGNVLSHINFPADVTFGNLGGEEFDNQLGGGVNPVEVHRKFLRDVCPVSVYEEQFREVARDFSFNKEIEQYLETLPRRFVSFHIRRGDKVRDEPSDGFFINKDELAWLNDLTHRQIDLHLPYFDTFFFCGDEDPKLEEFIRRVKDNGKQVFTIPPMLKWRATYYDLAVMSRGKAVIASQKYSAFSRFSAIKGNIPYATVYQLCE